MTATSSAFETLAGGTIVAGLGVVGAWLGARLLGKAAFKKSTDEGWASLTASLQRERETLNTMVHDVRAEMMAERMVAAAEHAALRSQLLGLTQTIISLEDVLRRNGIPLPVRPFVVAPVAEEVQATIRR